MVRHARHTRMAQRLAEARQGWSQAVVQPMVSRSCRARSHAQDLARRDLDIVFPELLLEQLIAIP